MAHNYSLVGGGSSRRHSNERMIVAQVLVLLFLCINSMLIITFLMKDYFYTTMRYILFANTLVSDCVMLIVTNLMLIFHHFNIRVQVWLCQITLMWLFLCSFVTPVTLTAMTLERYVAICMPLRHAELCTTRSSLHCILIIYCLSTVPCIVFMSIFVASVTLSFYKQYKICAVHIVIVHSWQSHLRSAISQLYFLIMFIAIVFSYVKIMKVAKAASGENKTTTRKGVSTVILHAFQLLLCLIQLWCPFIEAAVIKVNFMLFYYIKFFIYIMFNTIPRCLSPLIYGLRDEKFFLELKNYFLFVKKK